MTENKRGRGNICSSLAARASEVAVTISQSKHRWTWYRQSKSTRKCEVSCRLVTRPLGPLRLRKLTLRQCSSWWLYCLIFVAWMKSQTCGGVIVRVSKCLFWILPALVPHTINSSVIQCRRRALTRIKHHMSHIVYHIYSSCPSFGSSKGPSWTFSRSFLMVESIRSDLLLLSPL